jgi:hypothetical protein
MISPWCAWYERAGGSSLTEGESEQDAKAVSNSKRAPKRLGVSQLLAMIALAALVVFVRWPGPPLPFDTLHPHTQQVLQRLGVEPSRVAQGLGLAPASAGIHGMDGTVNHRPYCAAFDLDVSDLTPQQTRALLHRLRGAGLVCWWRVPGVSFPLTTRYGVETGPHIHGIDPFVPHKRRLELQIRDYLAGNDGIEVGRYAHRPDPPAACPQTVAERSLLRRLLSEPPVRRRG